MKRTRGLPLAVAAGCLIGAGFAQAAEFDTGNDDLKVRFDNTVKTSLEIRTAPADPALTNSFVQLPTGAPFPAPQTFSFPQALNFNAGDQNFQKTGLVSERVDLLSEFDAVWRRDYGFRLSAAAWYDRALHGSSDAPFDPLNGQTPYNQFPDHTKTVAGGDGEILDAFIFGGWGLGDGMKLTARVGQFGLQWGETLFFGDNGVARANGPIDIWKLLSSPNAQFKEIIRPVPQISTTLQLSPSVSVSGYYQFAWESDRLAPSGSYFSTSNLPWGSGQPEFTTIGPTTYQLGTGTEIHPKDGGQFGLQLKVRLDETDLGLYFAQYHDKDGQLYGQLATAPNPFIPFSGGNWYFLFPQDIKVAGISATHSIDDFNFAFEASGRDNMPLRSTNMFYGFFPGQPRPQYATASTFHANFSTLATFGPTFLSQESALVAEIAYNRVLHKNDPQGQLDPGVSQSATAMQFVFSPTYRQILPGLDLSIPLGMRYTIDGNSAITAWDAKGTGSANVGIEGNYLNVWQFAVTYTQYIGKPVPFIDYTPLLTNGTPIYGHGNPLADRDYIAISARRTF